MEEVHSRSRSSSSRKASVTASIHGSTCSQTALMNRQAEFVIDRLSREHNLNDFDCGDTSLNEWLKKFAWTNQQSDSAKTYVAVDGSRVSGYYALTAGSVHKHESPRGIAKGLANHPIRVV